MTQESSDDRSRRLFALAEVQRGNVIDALRRLDSALHDAAWDKGFSEGWEAGYRFAFERMQEAARFYPAQTPPPAAQAPTEPDRHGTKLPAASIVFQIIMSQPGLRGVEIVSKASDLTPPLKERTVRTALHRLKEDDKIESRDQRWYVVGEVNGHNVEERMAE